MWNLDRAFGSHWHEVIAEIKGIVTRLPADEDQRLFSSGVGSRRDLQALARGQQLSINLGGF